MHVPPSTLSADLQVHYQQTSTSYMHVYAITSSAGLNCLQVDKISKNYSQSSKQIQLIANKLVTACIVHMNMNINTDVSLSASIELGEKFLQNCISSRVISTTLLLDIKMYGKTFNLEQMCNGDR